MQDNGLECGIFTMAALNFLSGPESGTFPSPAEVLKHPKAAAKLRKPYNWSHEDRIAVRESLMLQMLNGVAT